LGIAWLLHGVWDVGHHFGVLTTNIPSWYPGLCFGIDIGFGVAALLWARGLGHRPGEGSV
jgi:hypothetical protein